VRDNGKLRRNERADLVHPQWFYYYAGWLQDEGAVIPRQGEQVNYTRYEPLGVVAAIVPWNSR